MSNPSYEPEPIWRAVSDIKLQVTSIAEQLTYVVRTQETICKMFEKHGERTLALEKCNGEQEASIRVLYEHHKSVQHELTEHKSNHKWWLGALATIAGGVTWAIDFLRGKP